jgi:hypothetical protein
MCFSAKARTCTNPKRPRSARALAASSASALVVTIRTSIGDRRKWSKDIVSSYTILRRLPPDVCFKPLITYGIELDARIVTSVCDNQFAVARKLLILKWRDVRVVEGARLESEAAERHRATPTHVNAHAISDFSPPNYHAMCVPKPRCSSGFRTRRITVLSQRRAHLAARYSRAATMARVPEQVAAHGSLKHPID